MVPVLRPDTENNTIKTLLSKELDRELKEILSWWMQHAVIPQKTDFYDSVSYRNEPSCDGEKGVVLYARLLWSFSSACQYQYQESYLQIADLAYRKIYDHFWDNEYGGFYWSTSENGDKKQAYGHAFVLYALTAYAAVKKNNKVIQQMNDLYNLIESKFYDSEHGGYFEAFGRDWSPIADVRLSEKDDNEKKSMNTHLHLVEAYASFYRINPQDSIRLQIQHLLKLFKKHIINEQTYHLQLFFTEQWHPKSSLISYGHDIEAAWLLQQCAEVIQNTEWINYFKEIAVEVTAAAIKGLDKDGGLWYEYNPATKTMIFEKHSWPQAEALIGFYNAYQLTGNTKYLYMATNSWIFIKNHIKDTAGGEWFWGVNAEHAVIKKEKAGFWKCPYHNTRACLEIINRIKTERQANHL